LFDRRAAEIITTGLDADRADRAVAVPITKIFRRTQLTQKTRRAFDGHAATHPGRAAHAAGASVSTNTSDAASAAHATGASHAAHATGASHAAGAASPAHATGAAHAASATYAARAAVTRASASTTRTSITFGEAHGRT
jgi:hypothetical protein